MQTPELERLETISRDYSETPRRVLFVLGGGGESAAGVFRQLAQAVQTTIDPHQLESMAAGHCRSLVVSTPVQMVPEFVRSLALAQIAIYQVRWLEEQLKSGPEC